MVTMKKNTTLLLLCLLLLQASVPAEAHKLDASHRLLPLTNETCPLGIQTQANFDISVLMFGPDVNTCTKDEIKRIGIFLQGVVNDAGSKGIQQEFGTSEAYFGAIMCTTESSTQGRRHLRHVMEHPVPAAKPPSYVWTGGGRANICAQNNDDPATATTVSFNANDIGFGIELTLYQVLPQHVDCLKTLFDVGVNVVQTTSMETTHYGCSKNLPKDFFDNV